MLDGFLTFALKILVMINLVGGLIYWMMRGSGGDGGRRIRRWDRTPPPSPRHPGGGRKPGRPGSVTLRLYRHSPDRKRVEMLV